MEIYDVYHNDKLHIGVLYVDFDKDEFSFDLINKDADDSQKPYFLIKGVNPSIKDWILERAPEPNASCIEDAMAEIGIKEYDAYTFFRAKEGRFIYDKISCIERK